MSMKLAIPTNPLYAPLVANVQSVCDQRGWTLVQGSEDDCATWLLRNSVDAALLTPFGYGIAVTKTDYRIVPGPMIMSYDFTNLAGIRFREHCNEVRTVASATPRDFMMMVGAIVLSEKFDITVPMTKLPADADAAEAIDARVEWQHNGGDAALDVSEEWADVTEGGLPLAFWVTRVENDDIDVLPEAVAAMADASALSERTITEVVPAEGDHFPREGRLTFTWSDDLDEALFATMQMLYFHQLVPEIPAVKVLGRD